MVNHTNSLILIVDDSVGNLQILAEMLRSKGFYLQVARDGASALDVVAQKAPDLILMDVIMPDLDGYEVCRRLRNLPQTKDTPIIFISALTDMDDKVKGFQAGGSDFITKPFQREEVFARINLHLQLKHAREELRQCRDLEDARARAEAANRAKSEHLAAISHDIRTPLHGVLNYADFGIRNIEKAPRDKLLTYFKQIGVCGERLMQLLAPVLELASLETGRVEFRKERHDVLPMINSVIADLYSEVRAKKMAVELREPETTQTVFGDQAKIREVFHHLLSNAVQFSDEGKKITIHVAQSQIQPQNGPAVQAVEIFFIDQGVGVPEEEYPRIFDSFFQSGQTPTGAGGKGIGLAICQKIIQGHQGDIRAEPNPEGAGSQFVVVLPSKEID